MKIVNVVGARPNFIKMAPIIRAMQCHPSKPELVLVHTGQHYDHEMSTAFFDDLGMPRPDIDLGAGSGSHAEQTARIMLEFEKVCLSHAPELVVVAGDVNSTLACALTAKKLGIRVAHVEAGLRSGDLEMPEEINRLCVDILSDYLFTTDRGSSENLRAEGLPDERIHFVGNVMIDSLLQHAGKAGKLTTARDLGLEAGKYALLTLHRPSNVDSIPKLQSILEAVARISERLPVVFPIHPRTQKRSLQHGLGDILPPFGGSSGVLSIHPLGYLKFLHLMMNARMVLTDSGGIQEETTVLGVPCITLRDNTERPITIEQGSNRLAGSDTSRILEEARRILDLETQICDLPELWDGNAANRIVERLLGRGEVI